MKAVAWSDGGGNVGHLCTCGAVVEIDGQTWELANALPEYRTNNEAEYNGLLLALRFSILSGVSSLKMHCDSDLIVQHVKGNYKCEKPSLKLLLGEAKSLIDHFDHFEIVWIPRKENKHADGLCREVKKSSSEGVEHFVRRFSTPLRPRKRPIP